MDAENVGLWGVDSKEQAQLSVGPENLLCRGVVESADRLSQAVSDRYRCPENFFDFVLGGKLSSDEGFFRFGPNAICYGRSCSGAREPQANRSLYDTLGDVLIGDAKVRLPFNPTEIIDSLRLERYVDAGSFGSRCQDILRKLYYLLRPLTNLTLRKRVQKFRARNWRKLSFPRWPVDTTVEDLCERLLLLSIEAKGVERVPFVWFWPRGARGCLMMTHDVETEAGRDSCTDLMDLDDSFGIKASFQIVPEERYAVPGWLLDTIRNRGFEVGIQDLNHDGQLFDSQKEFVRRAAVINGYASEYVANGFRAAVLYRKPEWYDALSFSFDMSFPNVAPLDPQRGGCCTVMPYFIGDLLELPVTTIQDYTLFHVLNMRSIDLWKAQVDLIFNKNGLASFIVHPDYVREYDTRSVYKELLGHFQELRDKTQIWSALPADVDSWWRARSRMSVQRDGDTWRVVGEGAERAVLAYAKNVDGNLEYELVTGSGTR
jgi:hypothetical protein